VYPQQLPLGEDVVGNLGAAAPKFDVHQNRHPMMGFRDGVGEMVFLD
jgi:hypothetical protein